MAEIAANAIRIAKDRASKATALAERMEPWVNRRYDEDSVTAWINRRTVPPADALLAAAKATDLSLDDWLKDSVLPPQLTGLHDRHSDVTHVFATRGEFTSSIPPERLFAGARSIDAAGLSLNLLSQQFSTTSLRELVEQSCHIRCLFLAPHGTAIHAREEEEHYQSGDLSALTQLNIDILTALRRSLPARNRRHLEISTYDATIRFNILLVNDMIGVVQPYMPGIRGVDSPTFVLQRREKGGLYPCYAQMFSALWQQRKPI
jgi:hypothetical protein